MTYILLTAEEIQICQMMGQRRRENALASGNKDSQVSKFDPVELETIGFLGEFIVAKHFNVMPDFGLRPTKTPYDLKIKGKDGVKTVDVKTTIKANNPLRVKENHRFHAPDIYIQVVLDREGGGHITGWITSSDLFAKATVETTQDRFGKNYASYVLEPHLLNKL